MLMRMLLHMHMLCASGLKVSVGCHDCYIRQESANQLLRVAREKRDGRCRLSTMPNSVPLEGSGKASAVDEGGAGDDANGAADNSVHYFPDLPPRPFRPCRPSAPPSGCMRASSASSPGLNRPRGVEGKGASPPKESSADTLQPPRSVQSPFAASPFAASPFAATISGGCRMDLASSVPARPDARMRAVTHEGRRSLGVGSKPQWADGWGC